MCLDLFYSFLRWEHAISAGECYSRSSGNIWCWSGFFLANLGQDYRRPQRSYFLVWEIPLLNKAFSGFLISDPSPFPKYVAVDQISLSIPELDRVKSVREITGVKCYSIWSSTKNRKNFEEQRLFRFHFLHLLVGTLLFMGILSSSWSLCLIYQILAVHWFFTNQGCVTPILS